jgi:hypothetical protein
MPVPDTVTAEVAVRLIPIRVTGTLVPWVNGVVGEIPVSTGAGGVMPVPVSVTDCRPPSALSATVSVPVLSVNAPEVRGANCIVIVHVEPLLTVPEQPLVTSVNRPRELELMFEEVKVAGKLGTGATIASCWLEPSDTLPKAAGEGANVIVPCTRPG